MISRHKRRDLVESFDLLLSILGGIMFFVLVSVATIHWIGWVSGAEVQRLDLSRAYTSLIGGLGLTGVLKLLIYKWQHPHA